MDRSVRLALHHESITSHRRTRLPPRSRLRAEFFSDHTVVGFVALASRQMSRAGTSAIQTGTPTTTACHMNPHAGMGMSANDFISVSRLSALDDSDNA